MIIVYGSQHCPSCRQLKKNFDYYKIAYEYKDITSSMKLLKEFLSLRDNNDLFSNVKEEGRVGIPLLIIDDSLTFSWKDYLKEEGIEKIYEEDEVISCSLKDGRC